MNFVNLPVSSCCRSLGWVLLGPMRLTAALMTQLMTQPESAILNVSSALAMTGRATTIENRIANRPMLNLIMSGVANSSHNRARFNVG